MKPLAPSVIREIRSHRFSDAGNTSCQEWRYHEVLKKRLPPDLLAVFPETLVRVMVPGRGWCLVEEEILNADGTPPRKFHEAYGFGVKRILRGMKAFEELNAQFEDPDADVSWNKLMKELRDKTGLVISTNTEDRIAFEYLGGDTNDD